jgi:hypothetical protein
MTWAVFALFNALLFAAYFIGKDAGIDQERQRNTRRRAHHHRNNNQ